MPKNELVKVQGRQEFMGKEIPVVLGGFGENQKAVTDKMVAEIHNVTTSDIRKSINRNITRFKENIDYIDLKSSSPNDDLFINLGYSKQQIVQAQNIYLLSDRGYAKLIKIMDTDLAWEIHDKLIDEYFTLKNHQPQQLMSMEEIMIAQLQEQQKIKKQLETVSNNTQIAVTKVEEVKHKLDKQMTINSTQQRHIQDAVRKKVYERLTRCKEFDLSFDTATHKAQFFSSLYSDLKKRFDVPTYRDILFINYDPAVAYVQAWIEPANIRG